MNNAVARAAGLLAVAVLPLAAGLRGDALAHPAAVAHAYRTAMLVCAGLLVAGGGVAFAGIPPKRPRSPAPARRAARHGAWLRTKPSNRTPLL